MRGNGVWLLPVILGACNPTLPFDAVSIRPVYGGQYGCTPVKISGHGFTDNTTVKIGDLEITDLECDPAKLYDANAGPTGPKVCDKGFQIFGSTPSNSAAAGTFLDVTVKTGDVSDVIPSGFYYTACPRPVIDGSDVPSPADVGYGYYPAAVAGTVYTLFGCGLDPALYSVVVGTAPAVPLTSVLCLDSVSFVAPDLPPGTLAPLSLVDGTGTVVFPTACDTADTAAVCDVSPVLQY